MCGSFYLVTRLPEFRAGQRGARQGARRSVGCGDSSRAPEQPNIRQTHVDDRGTHPYVAALQIEWWENVFSLIESKATQTEPIRDGAWVYQPRVFIYCSSSRTSDREKSLSSKPYGSRAIRGQRYFPWEVYELRYHCQASVEQFGMDELRT